MAVMVTRMMATEWNSRPGSIPVLDSKSSCGQDAPHHSSVHSLSWTTRSIVGLSLLPRTRP